MLKSDVVRLTVIALIWAVDEVEVLVNPIEQLSLFPRVVHGANAFRHVLVFFKEGYLLARAHIGNDRNNVSEEEAIDERSKKNLTHAEIHSLAITHLTLKCVQSAEDIIRKHPEQWLWIHKRWKSSALYS